MQSFRCGRDFAAWLGSFHDSSLLAGKKARPVSKAGQADIARLLIIGQWPASVGRVANRQRKDRGFADAREEAAHAGGDRAGEQDGSKIWAMLTKAEDYRDPALANGGGDREPSRNTGLARRCEKSTT